MKGITGTMRLMRIYIKESDHYDGEPLYLAILERLRDQGLSGATALRGIAGFGAHSKLHTDRFLRLTADLPTVLEVVGTEADIDAVLPQVDAMLDSGMITFETVQVMCYRHPEQKTP